MTEDANYIAGKKTSRIYVSKEFEKDVEGRKRPARFISRVFESGERERLVEIKGEVVLRVTLAGRQEVKALFYVDGRSIDHLVIQRFTAGSDTPHKEAHFALKGDEIKKLAELLKLIEWGSFEGQDKVRIEESNLDQFAVSDDAARFLARKNPKLIIDLAQHEVTERDIVAVAYRKKVLDQFRRMLDDPTFYQAEKIRLGKRGDEAVWQSFFEENPWIFGYGLFFVFASGLDERTLEQVVKGASIAGRGKRVDALLRTRGLISSLCFVEIKTPTTPLLEKNAYRPDAWAASRELSGAVAQAQRSVQVAEESIGTRLDPRDEDGNPTGESSFLFRPRSMAVIGSLREFQSPNGVNEPKFSSFELLRRQLSSPEVITFDELYERARFIVEASECTGKAG